MTEIVCTAIGALGALAIIAAAEIYFRAKYRRRLPEFLDHEDQWGAQ